ncbi:DNA polymerase iota [Holothuria leucospilota]|uniref:DNA polymerase iota n=1 Tax=Holothuria leucospilota TaxID=206669 RepID=A0A9Q0YA96_HOLLE|nr:DNA polymerase iota [Holothuria leucospilota]
MSDEDSFKKCASVPEVMETMTNLLEKLSERLQKDGRVPQTIRLTVRKFSSTQKWQRESRQTNIPNYVTSQIRKGVYSFSDSLMEVLLGLFNKMVDTHKPFHLTLINICFANFQDKSSPAKSLDTYFLKDKNSPMVKELKSSNTESDKVIAAALTTEDEKVTAPNMTKQKKFSAFEKYFKRHNNCDKKLETNGQEQRPSFFQLKSAKMSSAKLACDPNQGLSRPKKNCALESPISMKTARVSNNQITSKGVTNTESFEMSMRETDGKLVHKSESEIWHEFEKVHSEGLQNVTDSDKDFDYLPGISREGTVPLEEGKADLNHQPDARLPTERIDHSLESSSSSLEIPPDVDEAIFRSLPPEIREELLIDWRRKNHQSSGSTSAQPSQKYLSKLPHSSKKITDFFGKS